jgi:hypothetical protein
MRKISFLLVAFLMLGCSSSMVSRKDALNQIRNKQERDPGILFFVGRVGTSCLPAEIADYDPEQHFAERIASKAGYLTVKSDGTGYWKLELTDKGQQFFKTEAVRSKQIHEGGCNFDAVNFPVARKTILDVSGVRSEGNDSVAEYVWQWKLTDLGRALREKGDLYPQLTPDDRARMEIWLNKQITLPIPDDQSLGASNTGSARFRKYDDGWRIVD